jgi:hypothetical protein
MNGLRKWEFIFHEFCYFQKFARFAVTAPTMTTISKVT